MKTQKFTPAQQEVIDYLKGGAVIRYLRMSVGVSASALIKDANGKFIKYIKMSTFNALRDKLDVLHQVSSDYHSRTYTIKP